MRATASAMWNPNHQTLGSNPGIDKIVRSMDNQYHDRRYKVFAKLVDLYLQVYGFGLLPAFHLELPESEHFDKYMDWMMQACSNPIPC